MAQCLLSEPQGIQLKKFYLLPRQYIYVLLFSVLTDFHNQEGVYLLRGTCCIYKKLISVLIFKLLRSFWLRSLAFHASCLFFYGTLKEFIFTDESTWIFLFTKFYVVSIGLIIFW